MDEQQTLAGRWFAWVRDRWDAFRALEPRILDLQHRAAVAGAHALQVGDAEGNAEAKRAIERLHALGQLQLATADKVRELAQKVGAGGLGAVPLIPLAWAAAVISACVAVAMIFRRVDAEEQIVGLLEAGQLTAQEAGAILGNIETPTEPPGIFDELATTAKWAAVAVLGVLALNLARRV